MATAGEDNAEGDNSTSTAGCSTNAWSTALSGISCRYGLSASSRFQHWGKRARAPASAKACAGDDGTASSSCQSHVGAPIGGRTVAGDGEDPATGQLSDCRSCENNEWTELLTRAATRATKMLPQPHCPADPYKVPPVYAELGGANATAKPLGANLCEEKIIM